MIMAHVGMIGGDFPPRQQDWEEISPSPQLNVTCDKIPMASLPDNLRRLIAERGTTAKQIARDANLGPTYVRDIMEGRSLDPMRSKLTKIAAALGVTINELTGETSHQAEAPGRDPFSKKPLEHMRPIPITDTEADLVRLLRDFEPDELNDVFMSVARIATKRIRRI